MKRRLAFATGLALIAWAATRPQPSAPPRHVLGPFAPIAAQVQWVRAHTARDGGQTARAFALMESAVALEPTSPAAWITFANQLGLQFASPESGRPAAERADWLRAALQVLERGEAQVAAPEVLALHRAILLMSHAQTDATLPWPGATAGLFRDAARAGEDALAHAHHRNAADHGAWEASVRALIDDALRQAAE